MSAARTKGWASGAGRPGPGATNRAERVATSGRIGRWIRWRARSESTLCRRHPCAEQGGKDGSSRGADEDVGFPRVPTRHAVERGKGASHPRTAQDTSGAQDDAHSWPPVSLPVTPALCRRGLGHPSLANLPAQRARRNGRFDRSPASDSGAGVPLSQGVSRPGCNQRAPACIQ
jgi:hypothetical protein